MAGEGGNNEEHQDLGARLAGFFARIAGGGETDAMKKVLQDPNTPQHVKDSYIDGVISADQHRPDQSPQPPTPPVDEK